MRRPKPKNPKISDRLRIARKLRDITQLDLAIKTGLYSEQLSDYENGRQFPHPDHIVRIAVGLNISTDYIYGLSDTPGLTRRDDTLDTSGLRLTDIDLLGAMAREMAERNREAGA